MDIEAYGRLPIIGSIKAKRLTPTFIIGCESEDIAYDPHTGVYLGGITAKN